MDDRIYLVIYLLTEIINYQMAYTVLFEMNVEKSKKKWLSGLALIGIIHVLTYIFLGSYLAGNFSLFSMIIVPLFFVSGKLRKRICLYPIIFMLIGCIGASISFVLSVVFNISESAVVESHELTIICQTVPCVCMAVIWLYRKIRKYEKIQIQLDIKQYILFYTGIICIFFLIATLQEISGEGVTQTMINFYGVATSIVCLIILFLIIWHGITAKRESEFKKREEMYGMYIKMQEEHIKDVIEQDNKIRSLKHDIANHMIALTGYAKEGNNLEIQEYLKNISDSAMLAESIEYTGNSAVDAILRSMSEDARSLNICIDIKSGGINLDRVSVFDMCTIISNLLNNAIEACKKINEENERKIIVVIDKYESELYIMVKNTVSEPVKIANGHLTTTKKNKKDHGIGSENIRNTVKKYDGDLKYTNETRWFVVEILM